MITKYDFSNSLPAVPLSEPLDDWTELSHGRLDLAALIRFCGLDPKDEVSVHRLSEPWDGNAASDLVVIQDLEHYVIPQGDAPVVSPPRPSMIPRARLKKLAARILNRYRFLLPLQGGRMWLAFQSAFPSADGLSWDPGVWCSASASDLADRFTADEPARVTVTTVENWVRTRRTVAVESWTRGRTFRATWLAPGSLDRCNHEVSSWSLESCELDFGEHGSLAAADDFLAAWFTLPAEREEADLLDAPFLPMVREDYDGCAPGEWPWLLDGLFEATWLALPATLELEAAEDEEPKIAHYRALEAAYFCSWNKEFWNPWSEFGDRARDLQCALNRVLALGPG